MENKWKNKNLFDAFKNAINGIIFTLKGQINFKIQILFAVIIFILGFVFKFNITEFLILVITISMVFMAEMINTAIETVVDLCTQEYNEKAKNAKDIAAGAVVISAINSVIVGILLFGTKIFGL